MTNEKGHVVRPNNAFIAFIKTDIEQSITARFEQQVALHAERIAISAGERNIKYRDLNAMANRIAWALLNARGDHPEQIALLLESGELFIAAILGVLKSNKTYVPLDPSVPQKRNRFILVDSEAVIIITNNKHAALATELSAGTNRIINLDDIDTNGLAENAEVWISPNSPAYIIYTSGSTGNPKGVIETHRNLLHNVLRNTNTLHICADDRVTLLRSIGAAGAARDAFSALLNGAILCPFSIKEEGLENLAAWIERKEITILTAVISVFRHLATTMSGTDNFSKLRLIFAGGEQVNSNDIDLYQKHFRGSCLFVNRLGITETGTVAYYFIDQETSLNGSIVPVGYDAEDTEVLLLDDNGKEVEANVVGEIAVRSKYISPGYWKLPELNKSAFLPDPAGGNKRIYLTGDLGRKSTDGCLTHLGWKNLQVNIRGFRVEIAEIETELLRHPDIKEVAVYGRQHFSGETRLVAALVTTGKAVVNTQTMRTFLKDRLPDHMHPSVYLQLEELPLSANGKLDRAALPTPDWLTVQSSADFTAGQTEIELIIIDIWQGTLGVDRVGVKDNFFDLGGDSLLLGKIITKLNAICKIAIPLDEFFADPTVTTLGHIIKKALRGGEDAMNAIARIPRNGPLPLSFAQERLWFLHQLEPDSAAYNIPTVTLIEGKLDLDAMERALNEVVKRHESLRTSFSIMNGHPVQLIAPALQVSLPVADLSHLSASQSDAAVQRLINQRSHKPFDLAEAPLLRVFLVKLGADRHLLVTIHHLIGDAWSVGILFQELSIFYDISIGGESPMPGNLPVQYVDFAAWQRGIIEGRRLTRQSAYWRQQLSGSLPTLEIPSDRPRPIQPTYRGARYSVTMTEELTIAVKAASRLHSTTPFMTLLAAFKILLFRYTHCDDVIVGTPIAGRYLADVEDVIGPFANNLTLRSNLSGNPTFRETLWRVRESCLGAYAHQDLPFEKLVEELQPERHLSRNPLFQVMFIFQNALTTVPSFTGTESRRLDVDNGTTKLDLTVSVSEREGKYLGYIEYSTDLFNRDRIERMAGHFQTLLEAIVADPDQSIAVLPILTEAERHQILVDWNDTVADYPKDKCIHQLFEEQVERSPDAIALECEDKQITYRELNQKANQLAHHLVGLGIGAEKLVGICIERSIEMVVGLLGILKAGGAYLPLDPAYPKERLRFMLEDSQVSVLLTTETLVEDRGWKTGDGNPLSLILDPRLKVVYLDRDLPTIEQQQQRESNQPQSILKISLT